MLIVHVIDVVVHYFVGLNVIHVVDIKYVHDAIKNVVDGRVHERKNHILF